MPLAPPVIRMVEFRGALVVSGVSVYAGDAIFNRYFFRCRMNWTIPCCAKLSNVYLEELVGSAIQGCDGYIQSKSKFDFKA